MNTKAKIALVALMCGSLVLAASAAPFPQTQQGTPSQQSVQPDSSRPARPAPEYRSRLGEGLGKWLGLSPEQQAKFDALNKARDEEHQAMREETRKLGDELRALRNDPQADPRKADALIDRIEGIRADRMKSDFRFDQDLKKILTPEQRKKLDQLRTRSEERRGYRGYYGPFGYGHGYYGSPYYGYGYPLWGFGLGFGRFYRPFGFWGGFMHRGFFGSRFHRFGGRSHFGHGFRR